MPAAGAEGLAAVRARAVGRGRPDGDEESGGPRAGRDGGYTAGKEEAADVHCGGWAGWLVLRALMALLLLALAKSVMKESGTTSVKMGVEGLGEAENGYVVLLQLASHHGCPKEPLRVEEGMGVGKTALVTGAAGLLGSHVSRYLAEYLGMRVVGVDNMSSGMEKNVLEHHNFQFHRGDFGDKRLLEKLFQENRIDVVYHTSEFASEVLSHFTRTFTYSTNLSKSVALLNAAITGRVKSFVYLSASAVYGDAAPPFHELAEPRPNDPYGISKYAFELDLKAAARMFGLSYTIFRAGHLYGPHQNIGDRFHSVVGVFTRHVRNNETITIFGDGRQSRTFTYVEDVVQALSSAPLFAESRNQIFNLGGGEVHTMVSLAQEVGRAFGRVPKLDLTPQSKLKEEAENTVDVSKMNCFFGTAAQTPLKDGLAQLAQWLEEEQPDIHSHEPTELDISEGLPAEWLQGSAMARRGSDALGAWREVPR